eukprot:COSAG04_NODE_19274_length_420_cov_0.919003_1_plen_21_part_01
MKLIDKIDQIVDCDVRCTACS